MVEFGLALAECHSIRDFVNRLALAPGINCAAISLVTLRVANTYGSKRVPLSKRRVLKSLASVDYHTRTHAS